MSRRKRTQSEAVARHNWRFAHRYLRVTDREKKKVALDCLLFGSGFLEVPADIRQDPKRIPPWDVVLNPKGATIKP